MNDDQLWSILDVAGRLVGWIMDCFDKKCYHGIFQANYR
jgi:hypothetical protein